MSKKHWDSKESGLTIEYKALGTVSIDELAQALMADIQSLKEIYNIRYITRAQLRLPVTNEYGEPVRVKRPAGGSISKMDTHYFRPSCKDFDL